MPLSRARMQQRKREDRARQDALGLTAEIVKPVYPPVTHKPQPIYRLNKATRDYIKEHGQPEVDGDGNVMYE